MATADDSSSSCVDPVTVPSLGKRNRNVVWRIKPKNVDMLVILNKRYDFLKLCVNYFECMNFENVLKYRIEINTPRIGANLL